MGARVRRHRGAWYIFGVHGTLPGTTKPRRRAQRIGVGDDNLRLARQHAKVLEGQWATGDLSWFEKAPAGPAPAACPTFRDVGARWLDSEVALRCKPSTAVQYRSTLRAHWLPRFGDRPVDQITREEIKEALAALLTVRSRTTVRYALLPVLKGLFTYAVEQRLLAVSPAQRLGRYVPDTRATDERIDPFTEEELASILTVAARDFPRWYPALLLAARTGLRFGEWTALQAGDLDFRGGEILVRRRHYKRTLSTPKSGKGRRVDLSTQLAAVLRGYLTLREAEAAVEGQAPSEWLFPGPKDRPMSPDYFARVIWRPILRRAGVRFRGAHHLRHAFASLLLARGESLVYVRDQLGHASIKLTADTYGHLIPGANRAAVDRLDGIGPTLAEAGFTTPTRPESATRLQPAAPTSATPSIATGT